MQYTELRGILLNAKYFYLIFCKCHQPSPIVEVTDVMTSYALLFLLLPDLLLLVQLYAGAESTDFPFGGGAFSAGPFPCY
jgi:hypothetical protein